MSGLRLVNITEIHGRHEKFKARFGSTLDEIMDHTGVQIAEDAKSSVGSPGTFKTRTGRTVRAIGWDRPRGKTKRVRISVRVRWAWFLEHGTKAHTISARRSRFLRFYSPAFGRVIYRKSVNHPGTHPTFFLKKATMRGFAQMEFTLRPQMQQLAASF